MKRIKKVSYVEIGFLNEELNWIYLPQQFSIECSPDGVKWSEPKTISKEYISIMRRRVGTAIPQQDARYVKIKIKHHGKIPSGKPGAGENSWLFIDEISIN